MREKKSTAPVVISEGPVSRIYICESITENSLKESKEEEKECYVDDKSAG